METTIPFSGFYNSIHDEQLDYALQSMLSDERGDPYKSLVEKAFDKVDWQSVHTEYAQKYAEAFSDCYKIESLKFKLLSSPKYYNFETDRIFCDISIADVERIYAGIDLTALRAQIAKSFTSCDGFISHYPNKLDQWPTDLNEWDHNMIGTLLLVYVESDENKQFDSWDELEVFQYSSEVADQCVQNNLKDADRLFNIAYYLRQREERKHI